MLLIFAFSFNPDTKEGAFSGNIDIAVAFQVLQDILIAEMVRRQMQEQAKPQSEV